jgi:hypothetical protein
LISETRDTPSMPRTAVPRSGGRPPEVQTTNNSERGRVDPVVGSTTVGEATATEVEVVATDGADDTDVVVPSTGLDVTDLVVTGDDSEGCRAMTPATPATSPTSPAASEARHRLKSHSP